MSSSARESTEPLMSRTVFSCQSCAGDLRIATAEGKARTRIVCEQRRNFDDTSYADVLQRLETLSREDFEDLKVNWHKSCYSSFTSESKLSRLRKSQYAPTSTKFDPVTSVPSVATRRSSQTTINWSLCMFCQEQNNRKVH